MVLDIGNLQKISIVKDIDDADYIINSKRDWTGRTKINDYKTCCLKEFKSEIKNEEVLLSMIEAFFFEYEMLLKKEYNIIIDKFKKNMQYLGERVNILLHNLQSMQQLC